MKSLFVLLFVAFAFVASAQEAGISDDNRINKLDDDTYQVHIQVTPKKATSLLVELIKARETTVMDADDNCTITIAYEDRTYTVICNTEPEDKTFTKVSDVRKYVLGIVREQLKIE